MATITSLGIGSGLDIKTLVTDLVAAESEPRQQQLDDQEADYLATLSGLGTLKSAVNEFQGALDKLKDLSDFQQRSATSGDTDVLGVTAGSNAVAGSYQIEITQLAQTNKVSTTAFDATRDFPASSNPAQENLLTGGQSATLTLGLGANTFNVTIDDTTGSTLEDVAREINEASDNTGISATLVSGDDGIRMVLTGEDTGAANTITLGVSTTGTMDEKIHDLEIKAGAVQSQLFTPASAFTGGAGDSMTLNVGSDSFGVDLSTVTNLTDVMNAINTDPDNGGKVVASIESDVSGERLVLTGASSRDITVAVTSSDANLLALADTSTELQSAQDAKLTVDGYINVTRSSNTVSDAISGVSLTLKKAEVGKQVSLDIALDKSAVKDTITSFVDAYNSLITTASDLGKVGKVTDSGAKEGDDGLLQGDSTLRTLMSQVRNEMGQAVSGITGAYTTLAEIGVVIDTDKTDGSLKIDDTVLDAALDSNFDDIGQLFASDDGYAKQLDALLDNYTKSSGLIDLRTDSLNASVVDLKGERTAWLERMDRFEARLLSQFIAMDKIVASLQGTSSFLTEQLDSLPGVVKKDN